MLIKTAKFKLHNPTRHARAVLDHAFEQYTLGYEHLLRLAKEHEAELKKQALYKGRLSTMTLKQAIRHLASETMGHFDVHNKLRAYLYSDVAANLISHWELQTAEPDKRHGDPTARRIHASNTRYEEALTAFGQVLDDQTEYDLRQGELLREARTGVMPIYLGNPDGGKRGEGFGILYDADHDKFSVLVYLMANTSRRVLPKGKKGKQPTRPHYGKPLQPLSPEAKPWHSNRKITAIRVPLAMGGWHERVYLGELLRRPESVRAATLMKDGQDYYLCAWFAFEPQKIQPETLLGMDRGVNNLLALALLDMKGNVLKEHLMDGGPLQKLLDAEMAERASAQQLGHRNVGHGQREWMNHLLHQVANQIVAVALKHKAQVVVEDLSSLHHRREKGAGKGGYAGKKHRKQLGRTPYGKLQKLLEYKLPTAGLPRPWTVSPAYTSLKCPACGHAAKENREGERFQCAQCGYEAHADLNAARNIALKYLERKPKKGLQTNQVSA